MDVNIVLTGERKGDVERPIRAMKEKGGDTHAILTHKKKLKIIIRAAVSIS